MFACEHCDVAYLLVNIATKGDPGEKSSGECGNSNSNLAYNAIGVSNTVC